MSLNFQKCVEKEGCFYINSDLTLQANGVLNKPIIKEFFNNFTANKYKVDFDLISDLEFKIGDAKKPILSENNYVINVESNGIYAVAKNAKFLVKAFMSLLGYIKFDDNGNFYIPNVTIYNNLSGVLSAHYCLFYDTKLYEFERFTRFIGALGYTHLIIEFWGSYRYKTLPELGWKNAYGYDDIKPIINIANDLGVEVCPMFNHWGHASQCRVMHGKHVVLNQNPALYYLFDESGWCYNYKSKKVKELLKNVRDELIELCGDGEYFHIGCDEAYGFNYTEEEINGVTNFINEINADLQRKGRKTIMWGDMLLSKASFNSDNVYCTCAPTKEKAIDIINALDKSIIIADWQYHAKNFPVESCKFLLNYGFNVIVCPWDRGVEEVKSCIKTAKEENLTGVMHTTWHTLTSGMPYVYYTADSYLNDCGTYRNAVLKTASILRKVYLTNGDYEKSGFAPYDIGVNV